MKQAKKQGCKLQITIDCDNVILRHSVLVFFKDTIIPLLNELKNSNENIAVEIKEVNK